MRSLGRIHRFRRMRLARIAGGAAALAIALTPSLGWAEAFGKAVYDPKTDELVVTVLYSGTNPDHEFSLQWYPCVAHPDGTTDATADLIDSQDRDEARQDFKKTVRLSLADIPCRPARLTLHAAPRTFVSLQIPAAS